jgi:hypothetical protein
MSAGKTNEQRSRAGKVLTPGGFRPRKVVHRINPGQMVVQSDRRISVMANPNLVLTPGGFRDKLLVHLIEPGHALVVGKRKFRKLNLKTKAISDVQKVVAAPKVPALGSGWIAYTYWNNGTGKKLSTFSSKWIVPPAPKTQANPLQTIFLFNGIQNYGTNYGILQPVLQWGPSAAGGGNYWAVASWYVTSGGQAFHSSLVRVKTGDNLVGVMKLIGGSGMNLSYQCEFQKNSMTKLPVQNIAELLWFNETLEAYSIQQCSDYPDVIKTRFRKIAIKSSAGRMPVNWTPVSRITDCGQAAKVVSQKDIDIFYR